MNHRLAFPLPGALRLAEHAATAPHSLYHPAPASDGQPALIVAISATTLLLSAGVPDATEPRTVALDLAMSGHRETAGGTCPTSDTTADTTVDVWYLPLRGQADRCVLAMLRTASAAEYTHLSVDTLSRSIGVVRRRHRRRPRPTRT